MKTNKYDSRFNHSNNIQELFVSYLEKSYGYKFMAGDRNGATTNIDYIEEICKAKYIYPNEGINGPMLRLRNKNLTMPDELMLLKSSNKHQWFEVKNRTMKTLYEKFQPLNHYRKVQELTNIPVYIALVIKDGSEYRYFVRNIDNILNGFDESNCKSNTKIYFDLSTFKEI